MINKIMSQTRTTELDTITARIIAAYLSSTLGSDTNLKGIMNSVQPLAASLNQAINRIKSESELEGFDDGRDQGARSFYYLILGFTHHPDETIKKAALKIMDVFDHYGLQMLNENYATETSLLTSLFAELAKPAMQEAMALISGAVESLAALQAAQNTFEANHLAYEQNKAHEGTYSNASTIKKQLIRLINGKLVVYLKAMAMVNNIEYGDFVRTIAQIIDDNNETVKKRAK